MSEDWDKKAFFTPPPLQAKSLPSSIVADPAEVVALRVVLGVLIGVLAKKNESLIGQSAQSFINDLSAICQEALLSARLVVDDGRDLEKMRRDALDHVNKIVGSVQFHDGRRDSN